MRIAQIENFVAREGILLFASKGIIICEKYIGKKKKKIPRGQSIYFSVKTKDRNLHTSDNHPYSVLSFSLNGIEQVISRAKWSIRCFYSHV